ncbi:SPOR domain-containing protein [Thiogranum longum]|uniref:SPOR domain-containing protein n=1 Tax=Thiogranum longum TaxID=1537524 RepID=UPI00140295FF|nr:SPOR domain-containing protein [Thiogranum longum]
MKQRLVGAIVLVALGVIFIPMLLEGPNRTLVPEMDKIPEPETLAPELPLEPFPPLREPVPASRAILTEPAGAKVAQQSSPPTQAVEEPVPAPEPAVIVPPAPVAAPAKPLPIEKPVTEPLKGSWVVQVVSLSSESNALALRDKLRKGGFATQVEQVRVDGKARYRVRVGPFLDRAEADRVRKQVAERFDQNGRVMSYP